MHLDHAMLLQAATDVTTRLAAVEAAAKSAQSAGDAAWVGKEMRRRMGRPHVI